MGKKSGMIKDVSIMMYYCLQISTNNVRHNITQNEYDDILLPYKRVMTTHSFTRDKFPYISLGKERPGQDRIYDIRQVLFVSY